MPCKSEGAKGRNKDVLVARHQPYGTDTSFQDEGARTHVESLMLDQQFGPIVCAQTQKARKHELASGSARVGSGRGDRQCRGRAETQSWILFTSFSPKISKACLPHINLIHKLLAIESVK